MALATAGRRRRTCDIMTSKVYSRPSHNGRHFPQKAPRKQETRLPRTVDTVDDFRQAQGSQALQQAGVVRNHSTVHLKPAAHTLGHLQVRHLRFSHTEHESC